jgi:hypothetical protein
VAHVDLLIQTRAQQFSWFGRFGLWGHDQKPHRNLQGIKALRLIFLQMLPYGIRKNINLIKQLRFVQGGLLSKPVRAVS